MPLETERFLAEQRGFCSHLAAAIGGANSLKEGPVPVTPAQALRPRSGELPHQAASGSAEYCDDGTSAHLDRVAVQQVGNHNLVVVENVNRDRAPVQEI